MDGQSTSAEGVPSGAEVVADTTIKAPMTRAAIEALRRRFIARHELEQAGEAGYAWIRAAEVGELLTEVERLKVALRASRQADTPPHALVVALELLARDVRAYRTAQDAWLARRAPHQASIEAYERIFDDLDLVDRVRQAQPWTLVLHLTTEDLRHLADAAVQL